MLHPSNCSNIIKDMLDELKEARDFLRQRGISEPELGIVLGTGLGALAEKIEVQVSIPYSEIPHFPQATVEFHQGKLLYGELAGKKVLCMEGRTHHYEGYDMKQITFPIRVMKLLGINALILSNAAGSMNAAVPKGSLMLINDHINLMPESPLRGPNIDELGVRFPDMSEAYSREMNASLIQSAKELGIELKSGVYVGVKGPNLETAAEYRFLQRIGADAVGMSTVPEVIVAVQMGMPCAAISVITDECDPDDLHAINIDDIIATAKEAEGRLVVLMEAFLSRMNIAEEVR